MKRTITLILLSLLLAGLHLGCGGDEAPPQAPGPPRDVQPSEMSIESAPPLPD